MKIILSEEFKRISLSSENEYEIVSTGCHRLDIISGSNKERINVKFEGNFSEINIFNSNIMVEEGNSKCRTLNIKDSKLILVRNNIKILDELNLFNSNLIFNLPYEMNNVTLEVNNAINLIASNITLNNSNLKVKSLSLSKWSRIFCETKLGKIKLSIKTISEDDTSYVVLPKCRGKVEIVGVTL